jgi:hypothetical protein
VSLDGEVSKKGTKLKIEDLAELESTYNIDFDQDGVIGVQVVVPPPSSSTITTTTSESSEEINDYSAGSIVYSDDYAPFDRSLDVYGLKLLAWPAVGGSEAVSDTFLEKTAHTVTLLLDPDKAGIDLEAQNTMISGMQNGSSYGGPTGQRIGYISSDNYSPSIVNDSAGRNYSGLEEVQDTIRFTDYVWELDDTAADYSIDGAVTETLEHLLHTISQYGFPEAYPNQLNNYTQEGPLWDAMQEAIVNGVFNDGQYKPMDDGSNDYHSLVMREYVYILTYAEWDYITEFVDGGTLAPEWSDNSRTPEQVAVNNPLGHALYTDYISKIISKPSESVLKEIFSSEAPSGYIPSDQLVSLSAFAALEKLDNSDSFLGAAELDYGSDFSNDIVLSSDYLL